MENEDIDVTEILGKTVGRSIDIESRLDESLVEIRIEWRGLETFRRRLDHTGLASLRASRAQFSLITTFN